MFVIRTFLRLAEAHGQMKGAGGHVGGDGYVGDAEGAGRAEFEHAEHAVPVALRVLGGLVIVAGRGLAAVVHEDREAVRTGREHAERIFMRSAEEHVFADEAAVEPDATPFRAFEKEDDVPVAPGFRHGEIALIPHGALDAAHGGEAVGAMIGVERAEAGGLGGRGERDFGVEVRAGRRCIVRLRRAEADAPRAGEGKGCR